MVQGFEGVRSWKIKEKGRIKGMSADENKFLYGESIEEWKIELS